MKPSELVPLLNVGDVPRAISFYEDMGFTVEDSAEMDGKTVWAVLGNGAQAAVMVNSNDRIGAAARRARPDYSDLLLYFFYPSAEEKRAELIDKGYEVTEVCRQPYGVDECYVRDPDGYEIAIVSRVAGST